MSKPFFYRITAADYLAAIVTVPEADRGQWALDLALDMVSGNVDTAKSEFAKSIIVEAKSFSDKKREAANKRWSNKHKQEDAEDMQVDAVHKHSNASNRSSTEAVTVLKPKHLSGKPDAYTEDFLTFWAAYPKKTAKGAAFTAWKKVFNPYRLSEILEALSWQVVSKQWVEGFLPLPTTYLNQRRWEDEPETGIPVPEIAPEELQRRLDHQKHMDEQRANL